MKNSVISMKAFLIGAMLVIPMVAGVAYADSIGPNCTTCDGGIYTLHYNGTALPDADPLNETFRIFFDIDLNTYSGGGSYLDNVAVKVTANSTNLIGATLFSAPGSWSGPILNSGINAGGCSGSGGGFVCIDGLDNGGKGINITSFIGSGAGTDVTFAFDITVKNGTLFTGSNAASVKARYVDSNGVKIGNLLSEDITLQEDGGNQNEVPEPGTLLLLGSGLAGFTLLRWRKNKANA